MVGADGLGFVTLILAACFVPLFVERTKSTIIVAILVLIAMGAVAGWGAPGGTSTRAPIPCHLRVFKPIHPCMAKGGVAWCDENVAPVDVPAQASVIHS